MYLSLGKGHRTLIFYTIPTNVYTYGLNCAFFFFFFQKREHNGYYKFKHLFSYFKQIWIWQCLYNCNQWGELLVLLDGQCRITFHVSIFFN